MSYIEIQRFAAGATYNFLGPFDKTKIVNGKIHGKSTHVTCWPDGTLSLNNTRYDYTSVLFDPEGRIKLNRLLMPLPINYTYKLDYLKLEADGSLFVGAGLAQADLAKILGKLYKQGVKNIEGGGTL